MKVGEIWKPKEKYVREIKYNSDKYFTLTELKKDFIRRYTGKVKIVSICSVEDATELIAILYLETKVEANILREDFIKNYDRIYS